MRRARRRFAFLGALALIFVWAHAAPLLAQTKYPGINVDVLNPGQVFAGTTAFIDTTSPSFPRIVEIDMQGNLVWDYPITPNIFGGQAISSSMVKGPDLEWIPATDRFLFVLVGVGVFEVDRQKKIVWQYRTPTVSHDADRLPNGNTLMVWGWDAKEEAQATEVSPDGKIVWQWFAKDHIDRDPPPRRQAESAPSHTHANSVTRLGNGDTLISLRNYHMVVRVNPAGDIVWRLRGQRYVHDPVPLPNGHILLSTRNPHRTIELTRAGEEVWSFERDDVATVRGNERLPNGNTLLTERTKILEVTAAKEVVWQVSLKGVEWAERPKIGSMKGGFAETKDQWLYKAVRIPARR